MSTSTFDAAAHPRKGSAADTGNAGHFATKVLADAGTEDLDLDFDFLDADLDAPRGFGVGRFSDEDVDPMVGSLRASELHAYTTAKARLISGDYDGLDSDNLVSEAITSYLSAVSDKSLTTGLDKPVSPVAHDPAKARGFLFTTLKSVARREAFGTDPHDMKGFRALSQRIETETQTTGTHPTADRIDELAEEVRLSFPARRRPRIGFHKKVRTVSMDQTNDSGLSPVQTQVDRALTEAYVSDGAADFETGSLGDQLSQSLSDASGTVGYQKAKTEAAKRAWDVVRAEHDAPPVAHGIFTESQATATRKDLQNAGGVRAAIKAWNAAEDDHPAIEAVFAPFGGDDLTDDERVAVMEVLAARPLYAPNLIDTAIFVATTPRP